MFSTMVLYRYPTIFNREAIDVFLAAGSADKKVCVRLRASAVNKKQIKRIQPIKQMQQHTSYDLNLIFGDFKCAF